MSQFPEEFLSSITTGSGQLYSGEQGVINFELLAQPLTRVMKYEGNCQWERSGDVELGYLESLKNNTMTDVVVLDEEDKIMMNLEKINEANTDEDEDMLTIVCPAEVCVDKPKSKRGRKRKYPEGMRPRRRCQKKTKVYEMDPLADPKAEKKRLNALNAKRHRDLQKQQKEQLQNDLNQVAKERDELRRQVEMLQIRGNALQIELDSYKANTSRFLNI